jgi:hypothetical protein
MRAEPGYEEIMAQRAEIIQASIGLDYGRYTTGVLAFDYEGLLADTGYDLERVRAGWCWSWRRPGAFRSARWAAPCWRDATGRSWSDEALPRSEAGHPGNTQGAGALPAAAQGVELAA